VREGGGEEIISTDENVEELEPLNTVGGMENGTAM
jgi:hypothetical protein